jgi:hypothetical protein
MNATKVVVCVALVVSTALVRAGQDPQEQNADKVTAEKKLLDAMQVRARVPLEAREIKDAPYAADVVNDHTQFLADGNRIAEHATGRVYRDKDGRVRREDDRAPGSPSVSIIDPVAGYSYTLDTENHVAWRTPALNLFMKALEPGGRGERVVTFTAGERGQRGGPATVEITGGRIEMRRAGGGVEQHADEPLPARTIEGVAAQGHRVTTTIAAGAIGNDLPIVITSEEWFSPDLQVQVLTERKDPRNGDSSYRLLNIRRVDPDPSLFQVPADYTIKETGIRRLDKQ